MELGKNDTWSIEINKDVIEMKEKLDATSEFDGKLYTVLNKMNKLEGDVDDSGK